MVCTFLEYSSQYLLFTLVYTAKLISSCHCWSKWEYVRIMQTCMYMQGNGEESTLNICLLPKNSIFFRLLVCVFFLTLEPAGGEQCYKVHTHSGTVSYNTAESSQAESDDSASQCELLLLRLLTGDAAIYSEGSFNGLFHYVTFNGAMADWNSAPACFFNTIHDTYVHSRSNYYNPTLCTELKCIY